MIESNDYCDNDVKLNCQIDTISSYVTIIIYHFLENNICQRDMIYLYISVGKNHVMQIYTYHK